MLNVLVMASQHHGKDTEMPCYSECWLQDSESPSEGKASYLQKVRCGNREFWPFRLVWFSRLKLISVKPLSICYSSAKPTRSLNE